MKENEDKQSDRLIRNWWYIQASISLLILVLVLVFIFILDNWYIAGYLLFFIVLVLCTEPPLRWRRRKSATYQRHLVYIGLSETALRKSKNPVEELLPLIIRYSESAGLSEEELEKILQHFAERTDEVGEEATRLLKDRFLWTKHL
ncbi:MAG: hypothetical protein ACFFEK_04410 [Candidatus Thorarchaeota archaeon]